jgi:BirA family biotin operon repressor/biotin-[acetyl-CoA-carboxylase] ligase
MNVPAPLFTGNKTIFLDQVTSTNTYAMDMIAKTNPSEGTCVYTDYQSAGRGQIGRFWHSAKGENLLISYIFYPKLLKVSDQFFLNIISGLAVKDLVSEYCLDVKIKWPNDIYVRDQKIAGILVQNSLRGVDITATVIGVGLNVNEIEFPKDLPNPISIKQCTMVESHNLDALRVELSAKLEYYYLKMKAGQYDWLKSRYVRDMYRLNESALFKVEDSKYLTGEIKGIDQQGKLLIQLETGEITHFGFREIAYVI